MMISGRCMCGAAHYDCANMPLAMYNCHCHACQHASGAPYSSIIIVPLSAVQMHGKLNYYIASELSNSDHTRCGFCGICGAPLYAFSDIRPDLIIIKAPSLVDNSWFKPVADIWTVSAQPWLNMDTHIPKVYRSPPVLLKPETVDM